MAGHGGSRTKLIPVAILLDTKAPYPRIVPVKQPLLPSFIKLHQVRFDTPPDGVTLLPDHKAWLQPVCIPTASILQFCQLPKQSTAVVGHSAGVVKTDMVLHDEAKGARHIEVYDSVDDILKMFETPEDPEDRMVLLENRVIALEANKASHSYVDACVERHTETHH